MEKHIYVFDELLKLEHEKIIAISNVPCFYFKMGTEMAGVITELANIEEVDKINIIAGVSLQIFRNKHFLVNFPAEGMHVVDIKSIIKSLALLKNEQIEPICLVVSQAIRDISPDHIRATLIKALLSCESEKIRAIVDILPHKNLSELDIDKIIIELNNHAVEEISAIPLALFLKGTNREIVDMIEKLRGLDTDQIESRCDTVLEIIDTISTNDMDDGDKVVIMRAFLAHEKDKILAIRDAICKSKNTFFNKDDTGHAKTSIVKTIASLDPGQICALEKIYVREIGCIKGVNERVKKIKEWKSKVSSATLPSLG